MAVKETALVEVKPDEEVTVDAEFLKAMELGHALRVQGIFAGLTGETMDFKLVDSNNEDLTYYFEVLYFGIHLAEVFAVVENNTVKWYTTESSDGN